MDISPHPQPHQHHIILTYRSSYAHITNNRRPPARAVSAGVPRNSYWDWPTIHIHDLPKYPNIMRLTQANDIAIYKSSKSEKFIVKNLQNHLDLIIKYTKHIKAESKRQ